MQASLAFHFPGRRLSFPLMTHGVWARVQRHWLTFPRYLVHRIGINLYYLNSSDFARSEVLLGSLGLTILILGHPLNSAGKDKLLTKTGEIYNKNQLFIKTLVWKCVNYYSSKSFITHNIPLTSVAPFVGLSVVWNSSEVLVISTHNTRGLGLCTANIGDISHILRS